MTFRDIARKNLRFNIRKFASYFLVNAFVVCTLFLFGSLLFNDTINNDPVMQGMRILVVIGSVIITVFAIIFLIYTGFYFVRSRGREFGVYLTLGMTHKDLSRMAVAESVIIFAGATTLGIGVGLLFGNLFFLIVGRILEIPGNIFQLSIMTFLFSLGTLVAAFLVQLGMIAVFIRRLSIVNITKATKTKDAARQSPIVGMVSTVIFVLSVSIFAGVLFHVGWVVDTILYTAITRFLSRTEPWSMLALIATVFISLYFVIGSGINVIRAFCKLFPGFYQRHILLFSGLSHKFRAYRTILYSISILTGFAIMFVGWSLVQYIATVDDVAQTQRFHFAIEQRAGMNQISEYELRQLVEREGGEIASLHILPYMDSRRFVPGRFGYEMHWENIRTSYLVSDMYFNSFTELDEPLKLAKHELAIAFSAAWPPVLRNMEIAVEPLCAEVGSGFSPTEWRLGGYAGWHSKEAVQWATESPPMLYFHVENIQTLNISFINQPIRQYSASAFMQNYAHIIAHELWQSLTETGEVNHIMAFNLATGDHAIILQALIAELSRINNLPHGLWDIYFPEMYSRLRPLSFEESFGIALRSNGFVLFVFGFLGIIGLVSVFIVLYHKFVADVDDESASIAMFKKIGLTVSECRKYVQGHLAIVFFFPLFFGGAAALLLILALFMNQPTIDTWQYFRYVLTMYGGIVLFNVGLYAALRKRFFINVKISRM